MCVFVNKCIVAYVLKLRSVELEIIQHTRKNNSYRNFILCLYRYKNYYTGISLLYILTSLALGQLLLYQFLFYRFVKISFLRTCVRSRIRFILRIFRCTSFSHDIKVESMIALRPSFSRFSERHYHGSVIGENKVVIG